ncbi:autotransporter assembly complex protein TamA [Paracoccus seriniphilus]|uniref:Autotransporter secretion outer membrane protein TamA n=1 Tax=Paracoccus seriniphilus TaxID=184748 RepID=A0A239PXP7_9RHOB|nr:autotransporter assembly complex family protein [Paracoccus seriniphilus]WCR14052.1 outer membrane protein assembly factor [Paracoccus seriniphilus]SNT74950.1 autotransporter secretion outer membrane protein TamA [Paracoccus seriniphilus]
MRAYLRAGLVLSTALGCATMALGQSSSPFSGWFGGDSKSESPVDLTVRVNGGDDEALEKSIRNTSLVSSALTEGRVTGQDILAAARGDYARILGTLYDQGYYSALINITLDGVEAATIAPLDAPDAVKHVVVTVEPGAVFRFSRAEITPVADPKDISRDYARGEPAGTGTIKTAALDGVKGWRKRGHAKADVGGQKIVADHNRNSVDSQIALAPGPVVTFGKLNISGYDRMDPRRLRKIAGFPEGEVFDPEDIETIRKRLRRTGVFSAITLEEAEQLGPGDTMDVDLMVVEQKTRRIGAGFEISSTDGAQISAYWLHRNLLGGGESLSIDAEMSDIGSDVSGRDEEVTIRLERPATLSPDTSAYLETKLAREREEDYDSDSASIALGFQYTPSDELTVDIAVQYQYSRVIDPDETREFNVLALPIAATWDKRDDPTDARRGFYLDGEATPFMGFRDTDSGARLTGEGRVYHSFGEDDRVTLAGRAILGTILGSEIENTPRDYLFWSGGGGSVRGQAYESLGVEEITGSSGTIETGGMSLANASVELRFRVREKIGLAAFVDAGEVWTDGSWSGDSYWHAGAGAGVRYDTPVGPLRFDVAAPLGNGDSDDGVQVYLGLGQAF